VDVQGFFIVPARRLGAWSIRPPGRPQSPNAGIPGDGMEKEWNKEDHLIPPDKAERREWCAQSPKARRRDQIPQHPIFLKEWDHLRFVFPEHKIFPPYKWYKKACKELGIQPQPRFKKGIPPDVSQELLKAKPPSSVIAVYKALYARSRYSSAWRMRVSEISCGALVKHTNYSFSTVKRALSFLRAHRYARCIWRGRPDSTEARYRHSCYELPLSLDHVTAWRIHKGRPRAKKF